MAQKQRQYLVKWEIDITASSPEEAAWEALKTQRDRESEATAFDVELSSPRNHERVDPVFVDLQGKEDPRITKIKAIIEDYGNFSTYDVEADHSPCVGGAGFVISLAESFYSDKVTVCNYNGGREESEYDTTYEELPDGAIDSIVELADMWAEIAVEDEV
jgi:hypothetical protein